MQFTPVVPPDSVKIALAFGVAQLTPRKLIAAFETEIESLAYCELCNTAQSLADILNKGAADRAALATANARIAELEKPKKAEPGLKEKTMDFGKL